MDVTLAAKINNKSVYTLIMIADTFSHYIYDSN